ncbi:protein D3-like [Phlebotomus argentipes]|uniref:protein D3-like n=1 Tax=Phlebotomus argentipes TaxID=94469 RepID=UPI0028930302|nr:protein D3-like [Phlebotomus argentipes]
MLICKVLLVISTVVVVIAEDDISSKFHSFEIVPDGISSAPENPLEVKYPSDAEANYGNELTPTEVKDEPIVTWESDPEDLYTLLLVGLDAPTRAEPSLRAIKHWLVGNIPGNDLSEGETLAEYIGSGPLEDTGLHRYVFLVFKQPNGKIDFSEEEKCAKNVIKCRLSFSTNEFAGKYSLELFGGNFYQAQFDDYVPILHAQFQMEDEE